MQLSRRGDLSNIHQSIVGAAFRRPLCSGNFCTRWADVGIGPYVEKSDIRRIHSFPRGKVYDV